MERIKLAVDGLYAYPLTLNVFDSDGKSSIDYIADRLVEGRRLPVRLGRPSFDGRNLSGSMYAIDNMWHVGDIVGVDDKNVLCQFRPIIDPDGPCLKGCNSITILMFDHDVNRVPYCGFLYPSEG